MRLLSVYEAVSLPTPMRRVWRQGSNNRDGTGSACCCFRPFLSFVSVACANLERGSGLSRP
jgi:hypothetical protein